jgi:hypothetical protein
VTQTAQDPPTKTSLDTPAERALLTRITRFFELTIKELPDADQEAALAQEADILAVIETVARKPAAESAEIAVRQRGAIARQRLLNDEGGVVNPARVAELLGISRQSVGKRRAAGTLVGVPGNGGYVYPVWQFVDGEVIKGLPQVLDALEEQDSWAKLRFFLNGSLALDGRRPLDVLKAGKIEPVLRAARLYNEQAAV